MCDHFSAEFVKRSLLPQAETDLSEYDYEDEDVFDSRRAAWSEFSTDYSDDNVDDTAEEAFDSGTSGAGDSGLGGDEGEGDPEKVEAEGDAEERHRHHRCKHYHHRKSDNETANPKGK